MGNCLSCCRGRSPRWTIEGRTAATDDRAGQSRDGLYETQLADNEREAVADLLQYLENVGGRTTSGCMELTTTQRAETDFFSGDPLQSLTTLVYSDNVDLQRSASLTFAEITERGPSPAGADRAMLTKQMCARSTTKPSDRSFSSSRAPTLKCNEPRAPR